MMDGALIVGLGARLMQGADAAIGYKAGDASHHLSPPVPENQADPALWLCGEDRGELLHLSHSVIDALCVFSVVEATHSFTFSTPKHRVRHHCARFVRLPGRHRKPVR